MEPGGQASFDGHCVSVRSDRPTINSSLSRKVIGRRGDKNVIARERYCGAVRCVQAVTLYRPRGSCVAAHAKADGGRCADNLRICRVRAYLMNISVDVYG